MERYAQELEALLGDLADEIRPVHPADAPTHEALCCRPARLDDGVRYFNRTAAREIVETRRAAHRPDGG